MMRPQFYIIQPQLATLNPEQLAEVRKKIDSLIREREVERLRGLHLSDKDLVRLLQQIARLEAAKGATQ